MRQDRGWKVRSFAENHGVGYNIVVRNWDIIVDELVIIDEHALIHDVDPDDTEHAWVNFVERMYRGAPNEGEIIAIGYDKGGRMIEMVGVEKDFGTVVFHALTPPTRNVLKELGLER